jgi:hypothetical protein
MEEDILAPLRRWQEGLGIAKVRFESFEFGTNGCACECVCMCLFGGKQGRVLAGGPGHRQGAI